MIGLCLKLLLSRRVGGEIDRCGLCRSLIALGSTNEEDSVIACECSCTEDAAGLHAMPCLGGGGVPAGSRFPYDEKMFLPWAILICGPHHRPGRNKGGDATGPA